MFRASQSKAVVTGSVDIAAAAASHRWIKDGRNVSQTGRLLTFNSETKRGARIPGQFFPVSAVRRADWGSPQLRWFMQETKYWLVHVHAIGAEGYFAISRRRKAEDINLWSWALEWNQNFRVVGFFGAPHRLDEIEKLVPTLESTTAPTGGANFISYRADTQLAENEDTLFYLPAGFVLPPTPDTI